MKSFFLRTVVFFLFLFVSFPVFAKELTNFKATLTSDAKWVTFSWDGLAASDFEGINGYALQWGEFQNQVSPSSFAQEYFTGKDITSHQVFFSTLFSPSKTYYARIYTWTYNGRKRVLSSFHSSKLLKFTFDHMPTKIELEYITPSDLGVATSSSSSSGLVTATDALKFSPVGGFPYDTYAILSWSAMNVATTDASQALIRVSKNTDMSSPILEFRANKNILSAKVEGLSPQTVYYLQGCVSKNRIVSGCGNIQSITTKALIPSTSSVRKNNSSILSRLGLGKIAAAGMTVRVGDTMSSSSVTTSSSSSSPTKTKTSSQATIDGYTKSAVISKISSLKIELAEWEARLKKFSVSSSNTSKK